MKLLHSTICVVMMLTLAGCGGNGDGDPDGTTDAGNDQPSSCRQDPDPLNPNYRMTFLDLTSPDRLNNPALEDGIVW